MFTRASAFLAVVTASLAVGIGTVLASPVTPESLATNAGTSFRDTGIAIVAALIPLAVALILAKKALPWARRLLGV